MLYSLPIEIIKKEIFLYLDESARIVLGNVLWNKQIPDILTCEVQKEICKYSVEYLRFFESRIVNEHVTYYLSTHCNFEGLKWAKENNYPWDTWTCANVAAKGNLEILKWLREYECPWDKLTGYYAAKSGHLDIIKWARENGGEWDEETFNNANNGGHLDVIIWLLENGCPIPYNYHDDFDDNYK